MYDSSSDAATDAFAAMFGLMGLSFSFIWMAAYCLFMILGIVGFILWVVMLIDVARREDKDFPDKGENQKVMWLLIVILGGWIGSAVYYFLVYKKAQK